MENSATSDPENTAESSSSTTRRRPCAAKVSPSASGVAPRGDCRRNETSAWAGSNLKTANHRQLCIRFVTRTVGTRAPRTSCTRQNLARMHHATSMLYITTARKGRFQGVAAGSSDGGIKKSGTLGEGAACASVKSAASIEGPVKTEGRHPVKTRRRHSVAHALRMAASAVGAAADPCCRPHGPD